MVAITFNCTIVLLQGQMQCLFPCSTGIELSAGASKPGVNFHPLFWAAEGEALEPHLFSWTFGAIIILFINLTWLKLNWCSSATKLSASALEVVITFQTALLCLLHALKLWWLYLMSASSSPYHLLSQSSKSKPMR